MKILKYLAFVLGGCAALAVAAAAFIALTFDGNRLKTQIADVVLEKKQRKLAIAGDLELAFWPSLGVKLAGATLSEHGSDQVFAELGQAHVSLAILPLLRKQVVIERLELAGVKATVVRRADGTLNIDDLLAKEKDDSPALRFDIAAVNITDSQFALRDEQAQRKLALTGLTLATGRLGNAADGRATLAGRIAVDKPKIDAALTLAGDYHYDLDAKRYRVDKLETKLTGDALALRGADANLAAAALELRPDGGAFGIERLALALRGALGQEKVEFSAELPKAQVMGAKVEIASIAASARIDGGARNVHARIAVGAVTRDDKSLAADGVRIDIDAKQGPASFKGSLSTRLKADLAAQVFELPALTGSIDVAHPDMPMKKVALPLQGTLRADLAKQSAQASLSTRFDDSTIKAALRLTRFDPPALGFDVDIDQLNVDKYLPPKPAASKAAGDGRVDFSALKGLDLQGTVRIGAIQVSNVKAANIRLDVVVKDGRLVMNPIAANLYQGSLAGELRVNANTRQMAVNQTLTNVAVLPLLQDVAGKDMIEGRGTVAINLLAGGDTVDALKRSLSGNARLALRDGAIRGINVAKSVRELKARTGLAQQSVQQASQTEKTDFSELTASFRIAGGIARNDDLAAKSPLLRLGGAGQIDVGAGTIDYLAKASIVGTSTGQDGKELSSLRGVTVPVRLTGPLDQVAWKIDASGAVGEAVKAKVDAKVEEQKQKLQQKAEDKLKDQLKGLFGR